MPDPITFKRESLYDEVWADRVSTVSKRYGLSDNGLCKICRKLGVPLPPLGTGQSVSRPGSMGCSLRLIYGIPVERRHRYLEHIEQAGREKGLLISDESPLAIWLAWARAACERIDPLVQRLGQFTLAVGPWPLQQG